jgi:outer membrane receptor protein involved in Fe transport
VKDGFTVRAGVNNIFDKDPPIVANAADAGVVGNGNTYPGVYDALGRTFFVGLTAKF